MIGKAAAALSLLAIVVGSSVLASAHGQSSACASNAGQTAGSVASGLCSKSIVGAFLGAGLLAAGLISATLIVFAVLKQARGQHWREALPTVARQKEHAVGGLGR